MKAKKRKPSKLLPKKRKYKRKAKSKVKKVPTLKPKLPKIKLKKGCTCKPSCPCHLKNGQEWTKDIAFEVCPWAINSEDYDYCFWNFVKARSNKEGQMFPMFNKDIAILNDCSASQVHVLIKKAMRKLKKSKPLFNMLNELEGESLGESPEEAIISQILEAEDKAK